MPKYTAGKMAYSHVPAMRKALTEYHRARSMWHMARPLAFLIAASPTPLRRKAIPLCIRVMNATRRERDF